MFTSTILAVAVAAFVPRVAATVYTTSPIASTVCHGGQSCNISWIEDPNNTAPLLANWGTALIGLYAGNSQQQTLLQLIQDNVNVATTGTVQFTVDPTVGPNYSSYFIRFTSDSVADPNNPQFHVEAFSALFALDNMSGTFNATVQSEISGTASAPLPTQTSGSSVSATTTPSTSSHSSSSSGGASHSTSGTSTGTTTAAKSTKTSGAISTRALGIAALSAPLAVVFAALF